jgi:hypothetical protein
VKLRIAAAYALAVGAGLVVSATGASLPAFLAGVAVVSIAGPAVIYGRGRRAPNAR